MFWVGNKKSAVLPKQGPTSCEMLVGDQVICEMFSFKMTSFLFPTPPLSRHPSCQTPSKRQTSPDTGTHNVRRSDPTGGWKHLNGMTPCSFSSMAHLLHRNTETLSPQRSKFCGRSHGKEKSWPQKIQFQRILSEIYLVRFAIPIST